MAKRLGWRGLLIGLVVGLVAGGSFAWAAIPNSTSGAVAACYPTSGANKGALRVIDYQAGARCGAGQAMLTWPSRGFRWRGSWTGSTSYGVNDVVRYNGSAYIASKASKNIVPSNASYWALMAAKGASGQQGPPGPASAATIARIPIGSARECSNAGYSDTTWYFPSGPDANGDSCSTSEALGVQSESVGFDPADYPATATVTVRWWQSLLKTGPQQATGCFRLYDLDAHAPVEGTEHCESGAGMSVPSYTYVSSAPLPVSSGSHHYLLQSKFVFPNDGSGFVHANNAELVIDW